jgi:twitching motility protein PilT
MQAGKKFGMQTMNDALYQLYVTKQVAQEDCLRASSDQGELMRMMGIVPTEDGRGAVPAKK